MDKRMCLGTFSRRGAVASATIYPCAECASSRSVFIVWKRSFLYDKKILLHRIFCLRRDTKAAAFYSAAGRITLSYETAFYCHEKSCHPANDCRRDSHLSQFISIILQRYGLQDFHPLFPLLWASALSSPCLCPLRKALRYRAHSKQPESYF